MTNKIKIKFKPLVGLGEEKEFSNEKELHDYFGIIHMTEQSVYSRKLDTSVIIISSSDSNIIGAIYVDDIGDLFDIYDFDNEYRYCLEGDGYFELVDKEFNLVDVDLSYKLYENYCNDKYKGDFKIDYPFVMWYNR